MSEKKFSIIIPFYNSENYLKKSITSIINQTLDFEKNIELILVDDGSYDYSKEIAVHFKEKFPENISYLYQEHKGQSSAKNLGLKHATGEYINFLDSDDYLSETALFDVLNFIEVSEININIVAIPIYYFERCNKPHKLNYKFDKNKIIDLNENPKDFLLSASHTFIKHEIIDFEFNEKLSYSEDNHFILKLLANEKKFGVINTAKYFYRKRNDLTSKLDNCKFDKDYFIKRLSDFHLDLINHYQNKNKKIPEFIQYALVYDLQDFIKQYDIKILNKAELTGIFNKLKLIFEHIDETIIMNTKNINFMVKSFLFYLKFGETTVSIEENNHIKLKINNFELDNLNIHKIWINKFDISHNSINISGFFNSYFDNNNLDIEVWNYYSDKIDVIENSGFNESFVTTAFLDKNWHFSHRFTFNIPLTEFYKYKLEIIVKYFKDGNKNNSNKENIIINRLSIDFKGNINLMNEKKCTENFEVTFKDNKFNVIRVFNFSIITAIYNTEEYLAEAIDSILKQSLNFEDNVQMILVDDGSEDSSKEIALEYQKLYPKNIIVLTKENGGQASARNLGLKYATGRYLNFLDSDDYLSENTLEDILNFFNENSNVDVVAIPMVYFGRRVQEHILNAKFKHHRTIPLNSDPNNPLLSCSSSFFRKTAIKDYSFDTHLSNLEDALLINKILLNNNRYGVINSSKYYYRKRFDTSSTTDTKGLNCETFISRLKQFHLNLINQSLSKFGYVKEFIQYLLIYDLQWMIDLPELDLDELHQKQFWYYFDQVMKYIPGTVIMNNGFIEKEKKLFLYYLKVKDLHVEFNEDNVLLKTNNNIVDSLEEHWIWLDIVEIKKGSLNISGFLNSHFDTENISIEAIKKNNETGKIEKFYSKYVKYTARENIKYLSISWNYKYNFDISIPISNLESCEIELKVNFFKDGNFKNNSNDNLKSFNLDIGFLRHAKLSEFSNYSIWGDLLLKFEDKTFKIQKKSSTKLIKSELAVVKHMLGRYKSTKQKIFLKSIILRIIYTLGIILKIKRRPIYLFMDRIENADDNSEALFKYANDIEDNVKKYFVLDKNSEDYSRISKMGNVLNYRSKKHMLMYLFADKVISSHPDEDLLNPFFRFGNGKLFNGLINSENYFLQHGVTLGNISKWLHKFDKNLNLIVVVSDDEKNSLLVEGYNYDEKIIQVLGFPRFDNLISDNNRKQILLMPTWRKDVEQNQSVFINSNYYTRLNNILSNKTLIECCKQLGYKIIFKPHPRLNNIIPGSDKKFIDLLNIDEEIILSHDSYRNLFNNSSLLITDYSSVAFDFAYLKKPIIYYQPDDDYHHGKSYFDFKDNGFGEIVKTEEELIKLLKYYLNDACNMKSSYEERVESFYKYNDKNNCKRVYDWIKKD